MLGKDIHTFILLHLDPVIREPKVAEWLEDVTWGVNFGTLDPNGWFDNAHKPAGNFVLIVLPTAAKVVIEQLGFIHLK
jgi:hypothetical protein